MLMLPFIGYAIYKLKETLRVAAIIIFSLVIIFLVILETRAVWVGTLVGGGAFAFTLILLAKHFGIPGRTRWIMIIAIVVSVGAFAGIVLSGGGENEKTYLDRLKTITNPASGNNSFRIRAWEATIEMIADHPIVGVGTGNWKIHSQRYFSDKNFKQTETNWIRPHNDFLWAYAERGLLGFLLFMALFGIPIYFAIKVLISRESEPAAKMTVLLLLSGLLAYLFDSVFAFPYERINQQVYFTLFLAGITAEYLRLKPEKVFSPDQKPILAITGLVVLFSIVYGVSMLKSEYHIVRAKAAENAGKWKMLTDEATKAKTPFRTLEPDASAIEYYIGNGYLGNGDLRLAAGHYQAALKANPFDPFVLSNLGKIYTDLGEYKKGVNHLERALKLLPSMFEAKVNLGTAYYNLKEYRKALRVLNSIPKKQKTEVINGNIEALKKLIAENPQQDQKTGEDKQANVKQKKTGKKPDSSDTTNLKSQKSTKTKNQNAVQKVNKNQNLDKQGKNKNKKNTDKPKVKKAKQRDSSKVQNPNKNRKKPEKKNP
jgi:tetratricopeptide (TPR) repeat protein